MNRWYRWVGLYVGAILTLILAYSLAYNIGMASVENDPQSFLHSLKVVIIHFGTVGYHTEFPSSGIMMTLVGLIRLTGQFIMQVSVLGAIVLVVYKLSSSMVQS